MNNIGKEYDKSNYLYSGYWIATELVQVCGIDGTGMWNFAYDSARNALDFDIGNSSFSYTDNLQNNVRW